MNVVNKFKETLVSVLPVMAIVLVLGLTLVPVEKDVLLRFIPGGLFLILGLTIFLIGVDMAIQPMGERTGAELTKKRKLWLILLTAALIGFIVTVAEPDIQVFANQVQKVFPFVNKLLITFVIGIGVGLFLMIGLLRSVLNLSVKIVLFISYLILFTVSFFIPESFIAVAFDSGGATTGPMTVPFIIALGIGVSNVRIDNKNSFGLTGIASVGPVLSILIYSIVLNKTGAFSSEGVAAGTEVLQKTQSGIFNVFFAPAGEVFKEAVISILPIFVLFIVFQLTLLKLTKRQVIKMIIGFVYSFTGLTIFLIGVNGGFMQAGLELGKKLGEAANLYGGWWYVLLIFTGLIFGAIIVCAEPAVWCLSEQVEQVTGGTIRRKVLLLFLAGGTALAIGLSLWRAVAGFNLRWILIPGYSIALLLMIFCPEVFSGIAFDSGGVASGPLTSTFVLSFTIGASSGALGHSDSFGVIALVAMMPLIAVQLMGIIYKIKTRGAR